MEFFEGVRSVRLKSHLGTYLCADDADGVSHGYRLYSRGTVWVVEPVGDDYVRFQGHLGTYLGAADPDAALDVATPSCRVVQGLPSTPNDGAFLWTPARDGERGCLTLSGPLGRLLRVRFGQTHRDHAITIDFEVEPEESYWVVEPVSAEQAARLRPPSCDGRIEETAASGTASNAFLRFYSAKETRKEFEEPTSVEDPLHMQARRTIVHNTAREDGGVDDFDKGTWRYFTFEEQSLAALRRRLQEETNRKDFVICRRIGDVRRLYPVVLDLPPGNKMMVFVLVLVPSIAADELKWPQGCGLPMACHHYKKDGE